MKSLSHSWEFQSEILGRRWHDELILTDLQIVNFDNGQCIRIVCISNTNEEVSSYPRKNFYSEILFLKCQITAGGIPAWACHNASYKEEGEKMQDCSAINEVVTGEYTINIHKCIHGVSFKKCTPRALREIRKFAIKEMLVISLPALSFDLFSAVFSVPKTDNKWPNRC